MFQVHFGKNVLIFFLSFAIFLLGGVFQSQSPKNYGSENQTCFAPISDKNVEGFSLLSSFQTSFASSIDNRKSNIKLAAAKLDKHFIERGAEFSFNKTVGARTEKNGFKTAKIIFSGRFVDGVGGGVCQVSTTLYNAALAAGLSVSEFHPHTLLVSYVPPSTDAMVNSVGSDLKIVNETSSRVLLRTFTNNDILKICFYGKKSDITYSLESEFEGFIEPKGVVRIIDTERQYPDLKKGEEKIISYGLRGAKSKCYLIKLKDGVVFDKVLLRTDVYSPTSTIIVEGTSELLPVPDLDEETNTDNAIGNSKNKLIKQSE